MGATMVTMERDLPRLSQLPLPTQMLMLMPGTATTDTDTVATDGVVTTGLTATMVTTERGPPMLSLQQSQLLPLIPMLMLMPGTATMDMDTVATDGEAATGLTATTVTTERGLLRLNLQLSQLLLLTLKLMLMLGMDTTDMVVTTATDTDTATTAPTDTGVTGAKPTNREVDSSSDCDFPSTLASISRACA